MNNMFAASSKTEEVSIVSSADADLSQDQLQLVSGGLISVRPGGLPGFGFTQHL